MKTSYSQFMIMVDYMERVGDLSKPQGGLRGRHWCDGKWQDLTGKLNCEGNGVSRSEEKWRKVWSDLKNNTKKKLAKINRSAQATGGRPTLKSSLTDLEQRVLKIIDLNMEVSKVGLGQEQMITVDLDQKKETHENVTLVVEDLGGSAPGDADTTERLARKLDNEWNTPSTSQGPTATFSRLTHYHSSISSEPPSISKTHKPGEKPKNGAEPFLESVWNARQFDRERERMFNELERERIRQRDIELQLQGQWIQLMHEVLNVVKDYLGNRNNE